MDIEEVGGREVRIVTLYKSRAVGKTIQEGEVADSLTGQGPEMTQALLQEFFDSQKFDSCSVITENNDCIQFTRENGVLKVVFYLGSPARESEEKSCSLT